MTLRERLEQRARDLGYHPNDIKRYTAIQLLDAIHAAQTNRDTKKEADA